MICIHRNGIDKSMVLPEINLTCWMYTELAVETYSRGKSAIIHVVYDTVIMTCRFSRINKVNNIQYISHLNKRTTLRWPLIAARCRGDCPSRSCKSTSGPCSRRAATALGRPCSHAYYYQGYSNEDWFEACEIFYLIQKNCFSKALHEVLIDHCCLFDQPHQHWLHFQVESKIEAHLHGRAQRQHVMLRLDTN